MGRSFIVREIDGKLFYDESFGVRADSLKKIDHRIRIILKEINLHKDEPRFQTIL